MGRGGMLPGLTKPSSQLLWMGRGETTYSNQAWSATAVEGARYPLQLSPDKEDKIDKGDRILKWRGGVKPSLLTG